MLRKWLMQFGVSLHASDKALGHKEVCLMVESQTPTMRCRQHLENEKRTLPSLGQREHTVSCPQYVWWRRETHIIGKNTGLPWWRSGWESACQCRGHGFEPWSGKIPHAAEQLGPWATNTEPACLEPVLHNKRGRDSERPVHRDEEWPPLAATRESPRTETKTHAAKNKNKLKKKKIGKNTGCRVRLLEFVSQT